jgi:hypothetical protein
MVALLQLFSCANLREVTPLFSCALENQPKCPHLPKAAIYPLEFGLRMDFMSAFQSFLQKNRDGEPIGIIEIDLRTFNQIG